MHEQVESFFNLFKTKLPEIQLTDPQLETLMMFFPSLVVVASDGVIDDEEQVYVDYLSKFMAKTFKNELSAKEYEGLEASYALAIEMMLQDLPFWEEHITEALCKHIEEEGIEEDDIIDILYLFADASDGIAVEEEAVILNLKLKLGFPDEE